MAFEFFDPTGGQPSIAPVQPAERSTSLDGLSCSILDNTKKNGAELMTMLYDKMAEKYGVKLVKHVIKRVGSAPAKENELAEAVADVDFVIVGLGD